MMRYQIRTPENMTIEDYVREVAEEGWRSLQPFLDLSRVQPWDKRHFSEQVRLTTMEYVRTFDLCGTDPLCSDEVEGGPWLDFGDHIYHLMGNADTFVDDMTFASLETVQPLLMPFVRRRAFMKLQATFRRTVHEYLYYNAMCGKAEMCKRSRSISPWNHREAGATAVQ